MNGDGFFFDEVDISYFGACTTAYQRQLTGWPFQSISGGVEIYMEASGGISRSHIAHGRSFHLSAQCLL